MTKLILLTIPGKPTSKNRVRFSRAGGFVRTYSDQKEIADATIMQIKVQLPRGHEPLEGAIYIEARFYMPIPKSTTKKVMQSIQEGDKLHLKKPDLDNMVKFILDCMNGIVFKDDSQVVELSATKQYDNDPRTEIAIT